LNLPVSNQASDLIRSREAQALSWSIAARMTFFSVFTVLLIGHLLDLIPPGFAAETDADAYGPLAVLLSSLAVFTYLRSLAREEKHLTRVGVSAVIVDFLAFFFVVAFWANTIDTPDGTDAFLLKNEVFALSVVATVINTMALRPLYPILSASLFTLLHLLIMVYVLSDTRVQTTTELMTHFYTPAVNPGIYVLRILMLSLIGWFLAGIARRARRTIRDVVGLEVSNFEIRERQATAVLEGKMTAMSTLVSGMAHEVNNPLGVIRSALDTLAKVADRLKSKLSPGGNNEDRLFQTHSDATSSALLATERIGSVLTRLRNFARLDESDLQRTDVLQGLESALGLIDREITGEVTVERDLGELPELLCHPRELNQVFLTILTNAFEAMSGTGTLTLAASTVSQNAVIEIRDTSRGITPEELEQLFEVRFVKKSNRMSVGLGLPLARRIAEQHGGTLEVKSVPGTGTTFTLSLPLEGNDGHVP
jgi:signal transduction histidine kinase